ncbi:MAG: bifunctional phosphoglucose/phosphomannose isomerase [Candidatus Moranbacteria bacterium RIFCSPHIGHO2_12_FULL_54_9]|nr:MAG: bifunctional phosphoglucose/phosphomannose isomerase [Candidatus Moranbacteria bacterium RIFCSPHIGHO2_01_FULL_54_31]OGI24552.1 MAG: bifunctional phosphoglucose/phosphomannose isomerase [Candidatus Moranbacteria bacterium RIFCSPHIGHO2_12_FULL_54_9]
MPHPLDISDFRQMIIDSPDQLRAGFAVAKDVRIPGSFRAIMISGMGGSALPGNLFRIYLNDLFRQEAPQEQPLPIYQNRSYGLPPESYHECLNFICSYSGNTEETISSFEEALKYGLPCVGISSGGRIEEMCRENGIPHIKLPLPSPAFQPRVGTGYFFGAMFQVLVNQGLVTDTTQELLAEAEKLKQSLPLLEEQGKVLSKKLVGKTPVVYAATKYKAVAMVWKIKFNENAKTPAFWNFFSELNHNEMVGFTLPQAKFCVLMLRFPGDNPKNLKRFDVTAKLLQGKGVEVEIIDMPGDTVFSKVFLSILLGDFTAYYLALEYGQDPTPVAMVEELKKLLVS